MNKRCIHRFIFLLILLQLLPCVYGKGITQQQIDAAFSGVKSQVESGRLAGAVTIAAQHGEVRKFEATGFQDLENKVPMARDTIFRIYSMTKPITGAALMVLYDEGHFKLSDPVEKYIPEFAGMQVAKTDGPGGQPVTEPARHPMTIRELMSHTSGLTYGYFSRSQVDLLYFRSNILDRNSTLKDMVSKLAKMPLRTQPGEALHYSISVDVQAYLVEVISGISFERFLAQRIFQPLGMKDTAFYVPAGKADRFARYYGPSPDGLVSAPNAEYLTEPALFSGGGGLVSTIDDYLRFAQMHLNGGELDGVRILSREAVDQMRKDQLPESIDTIGGFADQGNVFGLDFAVVKDSSAALGQPVGNYWWWGIAGTWFWIDPVNEFIFIGMIQNRDVRYSRSLHQKTKSTIYGYD